MDFLDGVRLAYRLEAPRRMGCSLWSLGVLALLVAIAFIHWQTSRPKEWNSDAIKGISSTVVETFNVDGNKMTGSGFSRTFVVENKSGKDYTLPASLKFYKRQQKSQALEEMTVALIHAYTVPAKERAEVDAQMQYDCSEENMDTGKVTERDGKDCFQDAFGDASEFVGLDYDSRIRLNFPKPVFKSGTESASKPSNSAGPDFIPSSAAVHQTMQNRGICIGHVAKHNGLCQFAKSPRSNLNRQKQVKTVGRLLAQFQRWCVRQRATT